ncbi:hypothetical protein, partial [Streptomyces sp. NPDC006510]|uniref:hypothetical protein n=1 Tax=Streptomyces sp. NPDC006510 TaxID=3155600 RepID=UPI0033AF1BC4
AATSSGETAMPTTSTYKPSSTRQTLPDAALAIFASRKHGLAGRNWTTRYTYGWTTRLGVFRLTGNVCRVAAHAQR